MYWKIKNYQQMKNQRIRILIKWKPNKSRPRGKPRQRWKYRVQKDLRISGVLNGEEQANRRDARKKIVEMAMGLNGLDQAKKKKNNFLNCNFFGR